MLLPTDLNNKCKVLSIPSCGCQMQLALNLLQLFLSLANIHLILHLLMFGLLNMSSDTLKAPKHVVFAYTPVSIMTFLFTFTFPPHLHNFSLYMTPSGWGVNTNISLIQLFTLNSLSSPLAQSQIGFLVANV